MAESSPDSTSLFSFTNPAEAHACPEENGVPDVAQDDVAEEEQQDGRDKPSLKVSVESEKHYERFFSSRSRFETPDQERAALYRVFSTFDENQDGRISMEEMKKSFNKLGIALSDEALVESLSSVAVAEEGSVDFDGFCSLYRSMCQELSPKSRTPGGSRGDSSLTAAFKVFDKNGDGLISALELQSVLQSLGISEGRDLADFEEMIRKVDSNGDGQVSFSEFKDMMNRINDHS